VKPAIKVLALSGGVGGAKLALGLSRRLAPGELAVLVNTGDDFTHLGLRICPDLDTVLYTLSGVVHPDQGWGRANESFGFMDELRRQGGPDWFLLGDRDLVLHVERTRRLAAGETLTQIMADLATRFGVATRLLPMTDAPVATLLDTSAGQLEFQHYFVRLRTIPAVQRLHYAGAAQARPSDDLLTLLRSRSLEAIILCPSNPYLSIDPILAVPGLRDALRASVAPVVAVSDRLGSRDQGTDGQDDGRTRRAVDRHGRRRALRRTARWLRDRRAGCSAARRLSRGQGRRYRGSNGHANVG